MKKESVNEENMLLRVKIIHVYEMCVNVTCKFTEQKPENKW